MAGRRSRGLLDRIMGKSDTEFDDDWLPSQRRKMKAKLGEDMSKRVTEKSNAGEGVKPDAPKKRAAKKDEPTPTGNIGSVQISDTDIGPNMGKVNKADKEDKEIDYSGLSRTASDEDAAKVDLKSSGKADWVDPHEQARKSMGFKKGGAVRRKSGGCGMKSGGSVKSSASRRGDGCAMRGKTRGRIV